MHRLAFTQTQRWCNGKAALLTRILLVHSRNAPEKHAEEYLDLPRSISSMLAYDDELKHT